MYVKQHTLLGFILAIGLYIIFPQVSILEASIFLLATVLIDVDHYLYHAFTRKTISLPRAYGWFIGMEKFYNGLSKIQKKNIFLPICFLHSLEILITLFIIGIYFPIVDFIFYGFLFHLILDYINVMGKGYRIHKVSFIYEYIALRNSKKKN